MLVETWSLEGVGEVLGEEVDETSGVVAGVKGGRRNWRR